MNSFGPKTSERAGSGARSCSARSPRFSPGRGDTEGAPRDPPRDARGWTKPLPQEGCAGQRLPEAPSPELAGLETAEAYSDDYLIVSFLISFRLIFKRFLFLISFLFHFLLFAFCFDSVLVRFGLNALRALPSRTAPCFHSPSIRLHAAGSEVPSTLFPSHRLPTSLPERVFGYLLFRSVCPALRR